MRNQLLASTSAGHRPTLGHYTSLASRGRAFTNLPFKKTKQKTKILMIVHFDYPSFEVSFQNQIIAPPLAQVLVNIPYVGG